MSIRITVYIYWSRFMSPVSVYIYRAIDCNLVTYVNACTMHINNFYVRYMLP